MKRREEWRRVLAVELKRWSAMSCDELLAAVPDNCAYQMGFEGKEYQVEVDLIENTHAYVHLMVSVDDGSIPASFFPVAESFIVKKDPASG